MNKVLIEDVNDFAEHFELSESLRNKSFVITGATGLIGAVMIKCLLALNRKKQVNIKIIAVVRNIAKAKDVFGEEFDKIVFKQLELNEICDDKIHCHVDFVIHLASPTASKFFVEHPVETLRTAIEGTTAVLEYARHANAQKMVYASSLEVYGTNENDNLIDEEFQGYVNPLETRSSYNMGKRVAECLCHAYAKEYGVHVSIARLTQTFGAGVSYNDGRVFAQFARKIIEGQDIELHTDGKTSRMYCYITDAISAILFILARGQDGKAYNVANKESYISIRDMAQLLQQTFNPSIRVSFASKENQGYAPQTKLNLDTNAIEELGWSAQHDLKQMFQRLISSLQNNNI